MQSESALTPQSFATDPDEQLIVERISAAVMEQRLPPDTKLSESKLCDAFGVGRMHVRRALLLLGSQGIVTLKPNRGAFVASPEPEEADEVFESRILIETALVAKMTDGLDDEILQGLERHLEAEKNARNSQDRPEVIRLSGEFHVLLAAASGNRTLARVVRELVMRSSLIVALFGPPGGVSCPEDEHPRILAALARRDVDAASRLLAAHLRHIQGGLDPNVARPEHQNLARILGLT